MIGRRSLRSSHATLVAYLALFVALGGTAYAATSLPANSVGARQLRSGSVTTPKLHDQAVTGRKVANNSLTGRQINASTLGTVPNADHATHADQAKIADHATNADQLGGSPASTYLAHCPNGLKQAPGTDLCYEVTERPRASWTNALTTCALAGLRLPSTGELAQAFNDQGATQDYQWTSGLSDGGSGTGQYDAVALSQNANRQITPENLTYGDTTPYRCVTEASN